MFNSTKRTNKTEIQPIDNFSGIDTSDNPLGYQGGQLISNTNMEYELDKGKTIIKTRRGSNLVKDLADKYVLIEGASSTTDCYWTISTGIVTDNSEVIGGGDYQGSIKWDLSSFPDGYILTRAFVRLTVFGLGAVPSSLYWATNSSDFTVTNDDIPTTNTGTAISVSATGTIDLELDIADVQSWIDGDNFGISLYGDDSIEIISSDGADEYPQLYLYGYGVPKGYGVYNYGLTNTYHVFTEVDNDDDGDGQLNILGAGSVVTNNQYTLSSSNEICYEKTSSGVTEYTDYVGWIGTFGPNNYYNYICSFPAISVLSGYNLSYAKLKIYLTSYSYSIGEIIYIYYNNSAYVPSNTFPTVSSGTFLDYIYISSATSKYYEISVPISIIQNWIDNPSQNNGFLLVNQRSIVFPTTNYPKGVIIDNAPDTYPPILEVYTEEFSGSTITTLKDDMSDTARTCFVSYGQGTNAVLYGCNTDDGIFKVSGSPPAHSSVTTDIKPTWMCFSNISGRMIAVLGHNVYYSRINLDANSTTNLETWTGDFEEIFEIDTLGGGNEGVFQVGETVTGGTSTETAIIVYVGETRLYLKTLSGSFTANEVLTGGTSGATAFYRRSAYVNGAYKNLNYATVSPDSGSGFTCCIDNGQVTLLFKDTGIWALPNAENNPLTDWIFPKCDADIGTKSPNSVVLGRYGNTEGIFYLGSDKTLRFFNVNVERNSGAKPTLIGGSSMIISDNFQDKLDTISVSDLADVSAVYYKNYLILSFIMDSATENTTIFIDTSKLFSSEIGRVQQPYWFNATNYNNAHYINYKNNNALYGLNKDGYFSSLLVNNYYYDDVPTRIDDTGKEIISYSAYLGWQSWGDYEVELARLGVNFKGDYDLTVTLNSFGVGKSIPSIYSGRTETVTSDGLNTFKQLSANIKGNYFSFGISNNNGGEYHSLLGFFPQIKQHRRTQDTTNR